MIEMNGREKFILWEFLSCQCASIDVCTCTIIFVCLAAYHLIRVDVGTYGYDPRYAWNILGAQQHTIQVCVEIGTSNPDTGYTWYTPKIREYSHHSVLNQQDRICTPLLDRVILFILCILRFIYIHLLHHFLLAYHTDFIWFLSIAGALVCIIIWVLTSTLSNSRSSNRDHGARGMGPIPRESLLPIARQAPVPCFLQDLHLF